MWGSDKDLLKQKQKQKLATSLALTDHITDRDEHAQQKKNMNAALLKAANIYEARVDAGTLLVLRRDEAWVEKSGSIGSPVEDSVRLGATNYLSCLQMLCGSLGPTKLSVQKLQRAVAFCDREEAAGPAGWATLLLDSPMAQV
jgi:hypothetical protein